MFYILIEIEDSNNTQAYQETYNDNLQRITDLAGNTIDIPLGVGSHVLNANPTQPTWALPDPS